MKRSALVLLGIVAAFAALLTATESATAHPMGNFSINRYSGLTVTNRAVHLLYVVDMAEIPTFQELAGLGVNRADEFSGAERASYLARQVRRLSQGLTLRFGGRAVPLSVQADDLLFPPGAGGLSTERIYIELAARLPRPAGILTYSDGNFVGRMGWKEIVVQGGSGERIRRSTVPSVSRSQILTVYPTSVASSPPQDTSATVVVSPGPLTPTVSSTPCSPVPQCPGLGEAGYTGVSEPNTPFSRGAGGEGVKAIRAAEAPLLGPGGSWSSLAQGLTRVGTFSTSQQSTGGVSWGLNRTDVLTDLINRPQLPWDVLLVSFVVAFWFGAAHALSPGHGKTVVAAYLVGNRGTGAHAVLLGFTVTATHTAGVFALGAVTLYLSRYIVPDQLYPWLGFVSGLLVAGMGLTLFVRRFAVMRENQCHHGRGVAEGAPRSPLGDARSVLSCQDEVNGQVLAGGELPRAGASRGARTDAGQTCTNEMTTPWRAEEVVHEGEHDDSHAVDDHHHDHMHASSTSLSDHHHAGFTVHRHGRFGLPHSHGPAVGRSGEGVSIRSLLALGVSGGLLPCPSALVVLLSAIAFHRIVFGMLLIIAFSLGLATTLTSIGMLVVYSQRVVATLRPLRRDQRLPYLLGGLARILPAASALVVAALGSVIAIGALGPGLLPALLVHL